MNRDCQWPDHLFPEYYQVQALPLLCELYEESKNRKQRVRKLSEMREVVNSFDQSVFYSPKYGVHYTLSLYCIVVATYQENDYERTG